MNKNIALQKGFSLVEAIIFIVVMTIGLTGIMGLIITSVNSGAQPVLVAQATYIANAYMEEITSKAFNDPVTGSTCPSAPENRNEFNNVCDYQGYFNNDPITDQNGNLIDALKNYNVTVSISNNQNWLDIPSGDVLKIDVTVSHVGINDVTITGYRTVYQ